MMMTTDKSARTQEKPRGKFAWISIVIAVVAVLGLLLNRLDGRIVILAPGASTPTSTAIPAATTTYTSSPPTVATIPSTSSAQARAFAERILQAIANRPPDFEDDFSDPKSGWPRDATLQGTWGYEDGAYFIQANRRLPPDQHCCDVTSSVLPEFSDFVLKIDGKIDLGESGWWGIIFRGGWSPKSTSANPISGHYGLHISSDQADMFRYIAPDNVIALAKGGADVLRQGFEANQLLLIAKDSRIAVYVDGEPLWVSEDDTFLMGPINLRAVSNTDAPFQVKFDNFKIWDISDFPASTPNPQAEQARAFAEPILQAIADRPLDVEDDFSFDNGNWSLGFSGKNSAQIKDGVLRLTVVDATSDEWMGSGHGSMKADDFVVQFDARVTAMEFDSHLSILWRYLTVDNSSYQLALFPSLNGAWSLSGTGSNFAGNDFFEVANGNTDAVSLNEWFTVTIIGRGSRFAVLLDDQILYYFEDSRSPIGKVVLGMNIFTGDATAEFDNVKYWDLANVPGLP